MKIGKIVILILIVILFSGCNSSKNEIKEKDEYPKEAATKEFDNSVFKQLNKDEALDLYNSNEKEVVFICMGIDKNCQKAYDIVVRVQNELNYITNYLYIDTQSDNINPFFKEYEKFISKLDYTCKIDDEKDLCKNYLGSRGFTYYPAYIVIKDGKQVGGLITNDITYEKLFTMVSNA